VPQQVKVHKRIQELHPEIENEDVLAAWDTCYSSARRSDSAFDDYVVIGSDKKGRLLQLIAVLESDGSWLVYHAFTPPTDRVLKELGLTENRKRKP